MLRELEWPAKELGGFAADPNFLYKCNFGVCLKLRFTASMREPLHEDFLCCGGRPASLGGKHARNWNLQISIQPFRL